MAEDPGRRNTESRQGAETRPTVGKSPFRFAGGTANTGYLGLPAAVNGSTSTLATVPAIPNAQTTSVGGSTSGTAVFTEPFYQPGYKKVLIVCSSLVGTASYTFPTAFTTAPVVLTTSGPASSVVTSLSMTAITVTGATTTGLLVVEGY